MCLQFMYSTRKYILVCTEKYIHRLMTVTFLPYLVQLMLFQSNPIPTKVTLFLQSIQQKAPTIYHQYSKKRKPRIQTLKTRTFQTQSIITQQIIWNQHPQKTHIRKSLLDSSLLSSELLQVLTFSKDLLKYL